MTGADQARETAHNENRSNIQIIKTETEAELERIKKHLNELYSREADALRTSRDHAEMERDGLRVENERIKDALNGITQDLAVIKSQKDAECSEAASRAAHAELEAKRNQLAKNELERALDKAGDSLFILYILTLSGQTIVQVYKLRFCLKYTWIRFL